MIPGGGPQFGGGDSVQPTEDTPATDAEESYHKSQSSTPDSASSKGRIPSLLSLNPAIPPTHAPRIPITNRLRAPPKFPDRDRPLGPMPRRPMLPHFPRGPGPMPPFPPGCHPPRLRPLLPLPSPSVMFEGPRMRPPMMETRENEMDSEMMGNEGMAEDATQHNDDWGEYHNEEFPNEEFPNEEFPNGEYHNGEEFHNSGEEFHNGNELEGNEYPGEEFHEEFQSETQSSVLPPQPPIAPPRSFYVFCSDPEMHQSVTEFLGTNGMHLFDPYNAILTLAMQPDMSCLIFIHAADIPIIDRVPNLLRLKRNLRISFVTFSSLAEVADRSVVPTFSRAGLLVVHADVLLHSCSLEVFGLMCAFLASQVELGTSWLLMIPAAVTSQLDAWSSSEDSRQKGLADLIIEYMSRGMIETLPPNPCASAENDASCTGSLALSALDYQAHCVALQAARLHQFRHFFFISDMVLAESTVMAFIHHGIDIMNLSQFLRAFTRQFVPNDVNSLDPCEDRCLPCYEDALQSMAVESIIQ